LASPHCGRKASCRSPLLGDDSVDHLDDLEGDPEAERGQRQLGQEREADRPREVASGLRGQDVEPRVADEQRPGDRRQHGHGGRSPEQRNERRHERGHLGDVEPDPGDLPVMGEVLRWKRGAEVGDPRQEPDRDEAEHEQQPPP